jgi:DNA ligase-1
VRYQIIAEAYRDLEGASARLELIDRLAGLVRQTPEGLLPTVALLCQGQIAPDFAGVELGLAERLAARAVAQVAGMAVEQVLGPALVRVGPPPHTTGQVTIVHEVHAGRGQLLGKSGLA